jgi:hypothetical protein
MLTNIGILASGKGMVLVPNLSGLTKENAAITIANAGLIPIDGGSTSTENSALNNTIASQLPNAGELVPYESQVTYIWFNFVPAPTPPPTPTPVSPTPPITYWSTGCCTSTFGGFQVTGTSTVSLNDAIGQMNGQCGEPGASVINQQTGSYTTTSNIPTLDCTTAPSPTPPPTPPPAPAPVTPSCNVGEICQTILDPIDCITYYYVFNAQCECVFSSSAPTC